jgi:tetratricopeptide repeat protein 30
LTVFYPEDDDYKVYYAQALYQACLYEEAMRVTVQIENPELQGQVLKNLRRKIFKKRKN